MLAAARAAGVRRFVHVGTEAVLADGKPIVRADETRPDSRAAAPAPYPLTKGLAERAVLAANGAGELETVVVRPRFIWGEGDTTVLPEIVDAVKRRQVRLDRRRPLPDVDVPRRQRRRGHRCSRPSAARPARSTS